MYLIFAKLKKVKRTMIRGKKAAKNAITTAITTYFASVSWCHQYERQLPVIQLSELLKSALQTAFVPELIRLQLVYKFQVKLFQYKCQV